MIQQQRPTFDRFYDDGRDVRIRISFMYNYYQIFLKKRMFVFCFFLQIMQHAHFICFLLYIAIIMNLKLPCNQHTNLFNLFKILLKFS